MTPRHPPRFIVAMLDRFLPDNEPLAGDILEAARTRPRAWLYGQVGLAVIGRLTAEVLSHKRTTAEALLVATAMLGLLGFYAVVIASLVTHVLLLDDVWIVATGRYAQWQLLSALPSFVVAIGAGRLIGRFHDRHRLAAILAFAGSAAAAAFLNLYLFVPDAFVGPFVPYAALQTVLAMVFVGGLFVGIGSRAPRPGATRLTARSVPPGTARVIIVVVLAVAGAAGAVRVQAQSEGRFDVASIRRNESATAGSGLGGPQPGGRYVGIGVTLRRLVEEAYGVRVLDGPAWADSSRFDVNARAEGEPNPSQIRRMLRSLLAERFNLQVHTESREMAVYVLTLARADRRPGPQLRASGPACAAEARNYFPVAGAFPPPCGDFRLGARSLVARGMNMSGLAERLSGLTGRPVLDRTGLEETAFDIELEWSSNLGLRQMPRDAAGADEVTPDGLSLFTALQEQLGLRLDAARAPVEVLVIDSAEAPTD